MCLVARKRTFKLKLNPLLELEKSLNRKDAHRVVNANSYKGINSFKTMKHLFVPYELAKELKELGFDEPCLTAHNPDIFEFDQEELLAYCSNSELQNGAVAAPTHQQVVDWFREKHKIEVCASSYYYPKHYGIVSQIGYSHKSNTEYPESDYGEGLGKRQKHEKVIVYSERNFDDYYSALNAAIDEAIDIVKQV